MESSGEGDHPATTESARDERAGVAHNCHFGKTRDIGERDSHCVFDVIGKTSEPRAKNDSDLRLGVSDSFTDGLS
jgi:hypothetical protein